MSATLDDLRRALAGGAARATGMAPQFAAYVAAHLLEDNDRPLVVVTPDPDSARRFAADLRFFLPPPEEPTRGGVLTLPAIDTSPYADLSPDRPALVRRLAALYRLARGGELAPRAVVASASALLRRVVPADELLALSQTVRAGDEIDRDATAEALVAAGYERAPVVEDPGTFAVRGGVIDVFPALYGQPVRIDLFGDEIETLRFFDPQSQRTLRDAETIDLPLARETVATSDADVRARIFEAADAAAHPSKQTRKLLESIAGGDLFVGIETLTPAFHARMDPVWSYLPSSDDALWIVVDPDRIRVAAEDELELAGTRYQDRLDDHKVAFPPTDHYVSTGDLTDALAAPRHRLVLPALALADDAPALRFAVNDNLALRSELERVRKQHADELIKPLADALRRWRADGWRVAIVCDGASRADRLAGLLDASEITTVNRGAPHEALPALEVGGPPAIIRGALSEGFALASERLALLTADDIFGARIHRGKTDARAARRARDALLGGISDFSQLGEGDYLVHDLHGVGVYRGLVKLPVGRDPTAPAIDFLHIEYDGGTLYLPVYRLGEVQRYVGAEGLKPRLDKLGGVTWDKARRKVSREVRQLAEELLQLYAQRAALPGHAYPPADAMFREFEATFEFDETPDQQKAIDDVLADMESEQPMDRLVCGDVGYGKTEIALRAAFKAVAGGKQAAVLAPTTVLVEQHYRTMSARFEGWPVTVARLSRFQPRREQIEVIKGLAAGTIDVVIGTHRLLSRDVRFSDLGLIVIDEEQRFGVAHKERLKKMRTQVNVLTLTATPIPRTLHLAMAGLRDLSIIATPPADRRSIRTFVAREDDGVLREAIRRELGRGGQVFFVTPRIAGSRGGERSLDEWAAHLRRVVPEARVLAAHGQMSETQLEKAMVGFVNGEADILVSTTIIESGLDIPRANTMFVARSDQFGLAQLYQLRGRIGRSRERAFCYLLVGAPEKLTDEARRRLEALQRYTELGAGFQIASHDLEIRGAGELLGRRQSGSIASIGFDAYTHMLEEAVAELRGEPIHRPRDPVLNCDIPGFIPDDYVPDTGQRLDLYKRLASAEDEDELAEVVAEMADRYGPVPLEVSLLADLSGLRVHARVLGAESLDLTAGRLTVAMGEGARLDPGKVALLVGARGSRWKLTPDMRLTRALDAAEREQPTEAARRCLLELGACAT